MIKSLIILLLVLALAAGAFLSRPSEADFKSYVKQQMEQKSGGGAGRIFSGIGADMYVQRCTFKDRLLWVTVEREGKSVYTGAFNRWWGNDLNKSR